jgi:hypothetical protein
MLCAGVFLFPVSAHASAEEPAETLTVEAVWLESDALHIQVSDKRTGEDQTLELNLRDYAGTNDEFVTVQAIDRAGNKSNTIQFKNPYYTAQAGASAIPVPESSAPPDQSESGVPSGETDGLRPFTPDGSGTVLDNAVNGEGKEFFTIEAEDGTVFYLIVDRERTQDNVYFLNAVTEQDLLSLAKPGDGTSESGVPDTAPPQTVTPTPEPMPEPTPTPANNNSGMGGGTIMFIIIAAIAAGGAGFYFKILRPKKRDAEPKEDYDEPDDDYGADEPDDYDDGERDGEDE